MAKFEVIFEDVRHHETGEPTVTCMIRHVPADGEPETREAPLTMAAIQALAIHRLVFEQGGILFHLSRLICPMEVAEYLRRQGGGKPIPLNVTEVDAGTPSA